MARAGISVEQPTPQGILSPIRFVRGRWLGCAALSALISLAGCASEQTASRPTRDEALIHMRLVDRIDYKPNTEAYGLSRCANGVCVIEVLRDRYPYCVEHEIRHAFEGAWHSGRETTEGC